MNGRHYLQFQLFTLVIVICGHAAADNFSGRVIGVSDGDTIKVLDSHFVQHKVRLANIDAPESGQAYGQVAKAKLSELVYGQNVVVQDQGSDRYGRTIGTVYLGTANINQEMVRAGLAWTYTRYATDPVYKQLELAARSSRSGLWQDQSPVYPELWRKRNK